MARVARPWFWKQTGWRMAYVNGQKTKLAEGKENKKAARTKLNDLLSVAAVATGNEPTVTIVIERYLSIIEGEIAPRTLEIRKPYLQSFAEKHGWCRIIECRPNHMRDWLKAQPEWKNDWTKNGAVRNVQVAFNWAAGDDYSIAGGRGWKTRCGTLCSSPSNKRAPCSQLSGF
jgi:hypothetical protein